MSPLCFLPVVPVWVSLAKCTGRDCEHQCLQDPWRQAAVCGKGFADYHESALSSPWPVSACCWWLHASSCLCSHKGKVLSSTAWNVAYWKKILFSAISFLYGSVRLILKGASCSAVSCLLTDISVACRECKVTSEGSVWILQCLYEKQAKRACWEE